MLEDNNKVFVIDFVIITVFLIQFKHPFLIDSSLQVDGTDLFQFVDGHTTWEDYLTNMERDGTWGDHVILCAVANCYRTDIRVISSLPHHGEVIIKPVFPFDKSKPLVLGHIHEVHYVSLQPIQGIAQFMTQCKVS